MFEIPDIRFHDTKDHLCSNRRLNTDIKSPPSDVTVDLSFDSSLVDRVEFDFERSPENTNLWFSLWLNPVDYWGLKAYNCGELDMVEHLWGDGLCVNYGGARPPGVCGDNTECKAHSSFDDVIKDRKGTIALKQHVTQCIFGATANTYGVICEFGSETCGCDAGPEGKGDLDNYFNFRSSSKWNLNKKKWELVADMFNTQGNGFWVEFTNIRIMPRSGHLGSANAPWAMYLGLVLVLVGLFAVVGYIACRRGAQPVKQGEALVNAGQE